MDSLATRHDFLTAHEEIVGIAEFWVLGVRHRVEGTHRQGEAVENIEVGAELDLDEVTQQLFVGHAQILVLAHDNTREKLIKSFTKTKIIHNITLILV